MKVFRVVINGIGTNYVEAESFEQSDMVCFFREGSIVAQFPTSSVKEVTETERTTGSGAMFSTDIP